MPGVGAPMGMAQQAPLDTQTLQIASIAVLVFCCQPAGIFALIWLEEAKKQHNQGNLEVAQKKLGEAKIALIVGPVLGGVLFFLYVALQIFSAVVG
jgi:hypothetical protein